MAGRFAELWAEPTAAAPPIKDLLFVKIGKRIVPVWTADIVWIAAAGNYVRLHTRTGTHLVRATLISLLEWLDAQRFVQIHKSVIVNLSAVVELQPWFSGEMRVVLEDGTMLKLSRTYRQLLETRIRFLA